MGNDLFCTCQALNFSLNRAMKNTGNNPQNRGGGKINIYIFYMNKTMPITTKLRNNSVKKTKTRSLKRKMSIFTSFEDENSAEYVRLRRMTPSQRLDEFSILQERAWGSNWTKKPIKKNASFEKVEW